MRIASCLLALFVLATPALPSDAAKAFERVADRLPEPNAGDGFTFDGEVVVNGQVIGTCRCTASPTMRDGVRYWRLTELTSMGIGRSVHQGMAIADRRLAAVEGSFSQKDDGERRVWRFTDRGDRFILAEERAGAAAAEPRSIPHETGALATATSIYLFGRLVMPRLGTFEFPGFDTDGVKAGAPQVLAATTATLDGIGTFHDEKAFLMTVTRGSVKITVAYHPESHAFLGSRVNIAGRSEIEYLPKGTVKSRYPLDVLSKSAKSPQVAAARGWVALNCGDLSLVEDAFHWPTVFADMRSQKPAEEMTLEQFKKGVLGYLETSLPKRSRGRVESIALSFLPMLRVEKQSEDRAVVTFPRALKGMKLEVGRYGGTWYLLRIPGK